MEIKIAGKTLSELKINIKYPWEVLELHSKILEDLNGKKFSDGKLTVGEGTKILPGVYIEGDVYIGKNCKIGPNCYIRGSTSIGDNCHVGQAVEIKNSIICDNTNVAHLSYVGDSIIGNKVNFAAGTMVANLRHDGKNVKVEVDGELIDTGRRKMGVIAYDNAKTGIKTSIYPGRVLEEGSWTMPSEIVKKNKKS